jgi:hypothetical protein
VNWQQVRYLQDITYAPLQEYIVLSNAAVPLVLEVENSCFQVRDSETGGQL